MSLNAGRHSAAQQRGQPADRTTQIDSIKCSSFLLLFYFQMVPWKILENKCHRIHLLKTQIPKPQLSSSRLPSGHVYYLVVINSQMFLLEKMYLYGKYL